MLESGEAEVGMYYIREEWRMMRMRKKASQRKQCLTSRSHGAENAQGLGWEQTIVYSH